MVDHQREAMPGCSKEPQGSAEISETRAWYKEFLHLWRYRNVILAVLDTVFIFGSFILAYFIRFNVTAIVALFPEYGSYIPPLQPYLKVAGIVAGLWVILLAKEQAYGRGLHLSHSLPNQLIQVLNTGIYSLVFLMVLSFMARYFLLSRLVYLMGFIVATMSLSLLRASFQVFDRYLDRSGVVLSRVLFLGDYQNSLKLYELLVKQNPCTGIVGRLVWEDKDLIPEETGPQVPLRGSTMDLEEVYQATPFQRLIIVNPAWRASPPDSTYQFPFIKALNFCEMHNIRVYMVPDVLDVTVIRSEVGSLAGVPLIRLRDASLHSIYIIVKRVMDISVSLMVLIIGLPFWLLIAISIKINGPGPIFYVEERIGLHGRPFMMYKFRSMIQNADQQLKRFVDFHTLKEPVFNIRRDPRVTFVGRILRRTSLDEIPQLINVLLGSMSLVGPRPERTELVNMYNPYQRRRLKAKPGITGYQQVTSRGDPSLAKRIEYDLWYLKHQGFFLDIFILLKTLLVVIRGDGHD